MQFKVGDNVVHPVYGLGRIVQIEEKKFSEKGARRYYKVRLPNSIIWIPVEKAQSTIGLRSVTAKRELGQYRALLQSPPIPLNNDQPQRRYMELARRLKPGSFQVMCEVVRDLTASSWQKPLGPTDKATLQKTLERLCNEWATAAGISIAEAIKEINSLLRTTQQESLE